jgi:hypothetical protein
LPGVMGITPIRYPNNVKRDQIFNSLTRTDLPDLQIRSRPLWIEYPDACHHVMTRGGRGKRSSHDPIISRYRDERSKIFASV